MGPEVNLGAQWWRGATIYQIYPRSFADTTGDGIGDLNGITRHLDHVASLGVDGIWLSPFFTSPMADYGYDVSDYCDVDPVFGTLDDFKALLARAHALRLKVIIDQVYAHTSDAHPWFAESRASRDNPRADWFVWADAKADGSPPSNWQSVFYGPAWTWDARRKQYYMHNFLPEQPQLNLHNETVQQALLDVAKFWLDMGVDGFRLDALNFGFHNPALADNPPRANPDPTRPHDFQQLVNNMSQPELLPFVERLRALMDGYDARFTVAEIGGADPTAEMQRVTAGEKRLNTAYNFDFLDGPQVTPAYVAKVMARWPEGTWPSLAFSNHDAVRIVSRCAQGREPAAYAKLMLLLLLCLRGNPFIYYGEELGLHHADVPFDRLLDPEAIRNWPETKCRDGARTPMVWDAALANAGFGAGDPWLPIDPRHLAQSVAAQEGDPVSVLHFARRAIALRKASPALLRGDFALLQADENVLAFTRTLGDETMLCAFNLGHDGGKIGFASRVDAMIALGAADGMGDELPVLSAYVGRV
ncbi:MAG: alpha-glucosidase family protein [Novosphingobium sp.]